MAVEFEVKGSRTSEYRFLPEQLDVQPEMNGRHDLPDIQKETGKTDPKPTTKSTDVLDLADNLARMVVDEDQSIDKVISAARAYLKARGL